MKAEKTESESEKVSAHIQGLDTQIRETVETIRQIILHCDSRIGERIKWNNPSFFYNGEMKPFDPKEYKRDMIVFNLMKNRIMLVFPSGAKAENRDGFLSGDYKDGRRIAVFNDTADAITRKHQLEAVIRSWLQQID